MAVVAGAAVVVVDDVPTVASVVFGVVVVDYNKRLP